MALSSAQKMQIVRLLGWPGRTVDPVSTYYSSYVADRLTNIDDDVIDSAVALLGRINHIDTKLDSAIDRAAVSAIGDIKLNDGEMSLLRRERRRVISELANLFDIPGAGISGGPMTSVIV